MVCISLAYRGISFTKRVNLLAVFVFQNLDTLLCLNEHAPLILPCHLKQKKILMSRALRHSARVFQEFSFVQCEK